MSSAVKSQVQPEAAVRGPKVFTAANEWLEGQDAQTRITWALENLPRDHVVSSSFGIQSAVMLHLMTRAVPDIPVLLFDTGYLFPETYRFVDELTERLKLNLRVFRAEMSPAWQEARFGQLWEQGEEGLKKYNSMNKVEPMQRAMSNVGAGTWYSGLRRVQSDSRADRKILEFQHGRVKFHPIVDWSNRDIHFYLKEHDLPYHPLWEKGYVSVGDTHTTRKLEDGMREEDTRFFGMSRECGLHIEQE
ncbi:phosphoadenylyl-sulfate reductase [Poseidonocella sedimentorum]|uniref:Phosphoadenosine 5'-phosphosulfate reductase n=1 Tax=Poseidonocella sedimentorum TaxID=871652 RepID=A0A1I6E4H8_9RHOB|nr:phosphoadenylyl-sulfate reductase [Poseidonocella sedimentorum]SFR12547.1 phosphoadenylylsulfate reductase (thioredoxin) [Poseidonocella sedimentorum]